MNKLLFVSPVYTGVSFVHSILVGRVCLPFTSTQQWLHHLDRASFVNVLTKLFNNNKL